MSGLDLLELELRKLPGVAFVGFGTRDDTLVVHLMSLGVEDVTALRARAAEVCRHHVDQPLVVEVAGGTRPGRVRVIGVRAAEGEAGGDLEVELAFAGRQAVGRAEKVGPAAAAEATFEALEALGIKAPFRVEATALFEYDGGEGVMVVLGSTSQPGERYGVAAAPNAEEAAVRATLHALNRYLANLSSTVVAL
jgi:hypothetical protein